MIDCGEEMSEELLKMISKSKTSVLDLTRKTMEMGEEIAQFPNSKNVSIVRNETSGSCSNLTNSHILSVSFGNVAKKKKCNLGNLPSPCIRTILDYLAYEKISQLRAVNKYFDKNCQSELKKGAEILKQKLRDVNKHEELYRSFIQIFPNDHYRDTMSLFLLCTHRYEWSLGNKYYFVAGKVLDEFYKIYRGFQDPYFVDVTYCYRPNYCLYQLMDLVQKAINHFKFVIVAKYFGSTQKKNFIADHLTSGSGTWTGEMELELLKMDEFLEDQERTIKRLNKKNRKYFDIICNLNKILNSLKTEIFEKRNLLNEWKNVVSRSGPCDAPNAQCINRILCEIKNNFVN